MPIMMCSRLKARAAENKPNLKGTRNNVKLYKLQEIPEEQVTERFARRFFTGKNITLAFLSFKPDFLVPEHHHESEQFSYIITGSMRFVIGGEEVIVSAGEVVYIPSNVQ